MNAVENKQRMQSIFAELANGNGKPFVESMADDCATPGAVASTTNAISTGSS